MAEDGRGHPRDGPRRHRRQRDRERRLRPRPAHRPPRRQAQRRASAPGTYAYVDVDAETGQVDALGTDAIKVGQIYKPAKVTPVGKTAVLNTAEFVNGGDTRSRAAARRSPRRTRSTRPVASSSPTSTTSRARARRCDADPPGGRSAAVTGRATATPPARWPPRRSPAGWPPTRPAPATRTCSSSATTTPTPRRTRSWRSRPAGFTNLIADRLGADAYSYVFDGQWGYLDYALGSQSIRSQVTGVSEYHINADEPSVLDYNTDFKTPNLQVARSTRPTSTASPTTTRSSSACRRTRRPR